jgi:hypothetical protein
MKLTQDTGRELMAVAKFFDSARLHTQDVGGRQRITLDSAKSLLSSPVVGVPTMVSEFLGKFDERTHHALLDAVITGARTFEREHGRPVDPVMYSLALDRVLMSGQDPRALLDKGFRLDNATNLAHDQFSLQPAMAISAIMGLFSDVHPQAAYLPTDTSSNEARLLITTHHAEDNWGDYASGSSLNGTASGGSYFIGQRVLDLGNAGGAAFPAFTVTARNNVAYNAVTNPGVPVLRGRSMVRVNGLPCAYEATTTAYSGTGANTFSGSVTIAAVSYAITGTINTDTGAGTLTFAPALPAGNRVQFVAYVNYEKAPALAPSVGMNVELYKLYAHASRGNTIVTIDASTQIAQEAGLDARGQMLMALRSQFAAERFYLLHNALKSIAETRTYTWDFDYTTQIAQKDLSQIWKNLCPVIEQASQSIAESTMDHGADTVFMTGKLAFQAAGLPRDVFEPSGISNRPGPFRLGKFMGKYDFWYMPRGLTETGGVTSEMLVSGRGSSVARNPVVMGDAVPPMVIPVAVNSDMNAGDAFYTRSFAEVNPHTVSANAAVKINVINMA